MKRLRLRPILSQEFGPSDARQWLVRLHRRSDKDVLLEEYKALRAEVTTSMQAQISILAFGAATLGFSFAAASQASNEDFRGIFMLVLVPLVSYLILIAWFAEVMRMQRAGTFLMRLEKRLDEEFEIGALTWESTLFFSRSKSGFSAFLQDPDKFRTLAITLLLFTVASTSIVIGWSSVGPYAWEHFFSLAAIVIAAFVVAWLYRLRQYEMVRLATPWLCEGVEGSSVTVLQKVLADEGLYDGAIDEVFGAKTKEAVKRLQAKYGLEPDGKVGLMTMAIVDDLEYERRNRADRAATHSHR